MKPLGSYKELLAVLDALDSAVLKDPTGEIALDVLLRVEALVKGVDPRVNEEKVKGKLEWSNEAVDLFLRFIPSNILPGVRSVKEDWEVFDGPSIDDLLEYINERAEKALDCFEGESDGEYLNRLKVEFEQANSVILRPDEQVILKGDGNGELKKTVLKNNKLGLLLRLLREHDIYTDDINIIKGVVTPNMMRETSYLCVEIPSIKRMILVNQGFGEATFVIPGMYPRGDVFNRTKIEIQKKLEAKRIKFYDNRPTDWMAEVSEAIFADASQKGKVNVQQVSKARRVEYKKAVKRDATYYMNPRNARADLDKFVFVTGTKDSDARKLQISASNRRARIIDENNVTVAFATYLADLFRQIEGLKNEKMALDWLVCQAGYIESIPFRISPEYLENVNFIRKDLKGFAKICGVKGANPEDLLITHIKIKDELYCSGGFNMSFRLYLLQVQNNVEGLTTLRGALNWLLFKAGFIDKIPEEMDDVYYANSEKVEADLKDFAVALEAKDEDPINLTVSFRNTIKVKCQSGLRMSFQRYLKNARKTGEGLRDVLFRLLFVAGYIDKIPEEMNEVYFRNQANISHDLLCFAEVHTLDKKDVACLPTVGTIKIMTASGHSMGLSTYLKKCRVNVSGLSSAQEARDFLLDIAGY